MKIFGKLTKIDAIEAGNCRGFGRLMKSQRKQMEQDLWGNRQGKQWPRHYCLVILSRPKAACGASRWCIIDVSTLVETCLTDESAIQRSSAISGFTGAFEDYPNGPGNGTSSPPAFHSQRIHSVGIICTLALRSHYSNEFRILSLKAASC